MSKKQQLYNGVLENLTLNYLIISLKKIDLNLSKKKIFLRHTYKINVYFVVFEIWTLILMQNNEKWKFLVKLKGYDNSIATF